MITNENTARKDILHMIYDSINRATETGNLQKVQNLVAGSGINISDAMFHDHELML